MTKKDTVSLSLHVSPELNRMLEEMASDTHTTKSDVMRKAIAIMEVAIKAKQSKQKIGILDQNDRLINEIVGI